MYLFEKIKLPLKGIFSVKVFKNGELTDKIENEENLIVIGHKEIIKKLLTGDNTNLFISKIGFGTSSTTESYEDTTLTDLYVKPIDSYSFVDVNKIRFSWSLGTSEYNGKIIKEYGLFSNTGNIMFNRKVYGTIEKLPEITLSGTWDIII